MTAEAVTTVRMLTLPGGLIGETQQTALEEPRGTAVGRPVGAVLVATTVLEFIRL